MTLKDNTFYSDSNLSLRRKKALINYFSVPIKELRNSEEKTILVYPQSFSDTANEVGEQAVFDITKRDADGNPIEFWTRNLVGFISYRGQEVTISSRFSGEKNDNFLYYMLARVAGINLLNLDFSSQNKDKGLNLMIFLFPKLLKEALGQGLFKQYIYREYNDANVRGPIDINRHIRRNIPFNGRVAYRTREFSYDNPVTQLVRHAIEWIKISPWGQAILNCDEVTRSFVQEIVAATPTYEARLRQEIINQNLRPATHPYYTSWQPLQEFCLRLLRYESLSYGADKKNKIHGLLIDAAWLWEEYVGRVLAEKEIGLAHYTRSSRFHLLQTTNGKHFQQVIPDYYDKERKLVADAKYIPLHRYDHLDAERAAAVYYKTVMYMYRFDTKVGFLFHPCSQEDANNVKTNEELSHLKVENDTITTSYQIEDREGCWLHEVGMIIPQLENDESFSKFKGDMANVEASFVRIVEDIIKLTAKLF
jgi:5-methylcytosine-specific restriction endonuclease McrBC regulatory subunit McrC